MARRRTGWSRLRKSTRERLIAAGGRGSMVQGDTLDETQVRAYWEGGGDLARAYGHPRRIPGLAPTEPAQRASRGLDTSDDKAQLDKWRRGRRAPSWIPKSRAAMGDETAAALSSIDLPPERWGEVSFTYDPADGRFLMTVSPKGRGPDRTTYLPNHEAVGDVARFIRDPVPAGATAGQRKKLEQQWSRVQIRVNATGTDLVSVNKAKKKSAAASKRAADRRKAAKAKKVSIGRGLAAKPSPKPYSGSSKPSSAKKTRTPIRKATAHRPPAARKPAQPKAPRKTPPAPGSRKRKR